MSDPDAVVYRERHRLKRPPELVEPDLAFQLGEPSGGERTRRWRYDAIGKLYRYETTLDAAAGTVAVTVAVPRWYRPVAASAFVAIAVLLAVPLADVAVATLLWGYALVALLPIAHLWPGGPAERPAFGDAAVAVKRRLTASTVPPYLAVVAALWAAFTEPTLLAAVASGAGVPVVGTVVVGALLVVGLGAYVTGGALRVGGSRSGARTVGPVTRGDGRPTAAGLPTVGIPLSALLAAVVAGGNVVVARAVLSGARGTAALATVVAVALAMDVTYFQYCRVAIRGFAGARVVALGRRSARVLALAAHLAANVTLGAAAVVGAAVLAAGVLGAPALPAPLAGLATLPVVPGLPSVARQALAGTVSAVLVAPVLVTGFGWTYKVVTDGVLVTSVLRSSRALELPAPLADVGVDVSVRVADVGVPVLRPLRLPLVSGFVVVDRAVLEGLSEEELAAAVAHEAYHLRVDPSLTVLGTLAAVAVGGRNALLALVDYPGLERAADDFAAEHVGAEPLVRALRRVEALRLEQGTAARWQRFVDGTGAEAADRSASGGVGPGALVRELVTAPYRLLFGPVLQDAAHDDVDERVERLVGD